VAFSAGGDGARKPVRARIANAKSIGWAIYAAGFALWLFGYLSACRFGAGHGTSEGRNQGYAKIACFRAEIKFSGPRTPRKRTFKPLISLRNLAQKKKRGRGDFDRLKNSAAAALGIFAALHKKAIPPVVSMG
jgi:hypothetical protein